MDSKKERGHPHVVHVDEVEGTRIEKGERYGFVRKQLGAAAGGRQLGCSWMELAPGKSAWPAHFHCANEEAVFILEGEGIASVGGKEIPVRAGDYLSYPAGPDSAHRMTNASDSKPLRYLCFSTMIPTDVTVYPESGKVGVFGGAAPGGEKKARFVEGFYRRKDAVDYWEDERTD